MKELAAALCRARLAFKPVKKDSTNPHFRSKFASLESVLEATNEALAAEGLAVVQFPSSKKGFPTLRTILVHTSGESLEDEMLLNAVKNDPQGQGSAITYARRYALMSVLGLAAEDDDGNTASVSDKGGAEKTRQAEQRSESVNKPSRETTVGDPSSSQEAEGGSPFKVPDKARAKARAKAEPDQRPVAGREADLADPATIKHLESMVDAIAALRGVGSDKVLKALEQDFGPTHLMTEAQAAEAQAKLVAWKKQLERSA